MENITWGAFLSLMVGPAANGIAGIALSYAAEYWPWYAGLQPKISRLFFIGLCFAIPILATTAAIATGEFGQWTDWQTTWWPAIVAGAASSGIGTLAHTRKL